MFETGETVAQPQQCTMIAKVHQQQMVVHRPTSSFDYVVVVASELAVLGAAFAAAVVVLALPTMHARVLQQREQEWLTYSLTRKTPSTMKEQGEKMVVSVGAVERMIAAEP